MSERAAHDARSSREDHEVYSSHRRHAVSHGTHRVPQNHPKVTATRATTGGRRESDMPFLRPWTPRAQILPARTLRAVTLAAACAMTLVTAAPAHAEPAPAPAHAVLGPTPRLVTDALPARALPPVPAADAAHFCPRPTGRWWDDLTVRGCVELLTGRDHTTPVTGTELTWLDLGGLPAFAAIDIDAIDATIAAYEQRLLEEEERARAEAAERARAEREAARAARRTNARRQVQRERPGQPWPNATIDRVLLDCGYHDTTPRSLEEQVHHGERTTACIESRMPGYWDWVMAAERERFGITIDPEEEARQACLAQLGPMTSLDPAAARAYSDTLARCIDQQVPGHYARWAEAEARRQAEFEEAMAREAVARAAFEARLAAAREEAAATCPNGWSVSYGGWMVSSLEEVKITIWCD